jgi:single-strand DNA-binding protein
MRGVNKVILVGNATRDAELRHTSTGKPVSSVRLATNRQVKGEEATQFHTVVCWDRLAETTAECVKKGNRLYVERRLQYRVYQDEEGKDRGVAEVVADDVQFLGRLSNGSRADRSGVPADNRTPARSTSPSGVQDTSTPYCPRPTRIGTTRSINAPSTSRCAAMSPSRIAAHHPSATTSRVSSRGAQRSVRALAGG